MDAIVYTSNTGFTKEYAEILSHIINVSCYSLDEAEKNIQGGANIIYLGWLMAGNIKGFKKANKKYKICALCGVGMGKSGTQIEDIRKVNHLLPSMPLFTLQGGFELSRLHGIYKFMMSFMKKATLGKLEKKENLSEDDKDMLLLIKNGESRVSEKNLAPVIEWYKSTKN